MTTTTEIDVRQYGKLLSKVAPTIIKSEAENERLLAITESLLAKGEGNLTPEEDALLDLLSNLIHTYEARAYPIAKSAPHEIVAYLLERRGLSAKDLWPVIGSKGRVSEILSGKREISKEQARMLAEFFGVRMVLFL